MNKGNNDTLLPHRIFCRLQKRSSNAFVLFGCLHKKSVKKGFRWVFGFRIANASDHAIFLVDGDPKPIPTVKVVRLDIQQVLADGRLSSQGILGLQNHKNEVISVFFFKRFDDHGLSPRKTSCLSVLYHNSTTRQCERAT